MKDTYDFTEKNRGVKITRNSLLFTIDIDSLYTNIETQAGIVAVRECMRKFPDSKRPHEYVATD